MGPLLSISEGVGSFFVDLDVSGSLLSEDVLLNTPPIFYLI